MNQYMKLLGLKVKDRVTGYTGIVSSVTFDLYGCVQCIVIPLAIIEGGAAKLTDSHWFDHKRLEVIDPTPVMPVPTFVRAGDENGPAERPSISTRSGN